MAEGEKWIIHSITEWRLVPEEEPTMLYAEMVMMTPDEHQYLAIANAHYPTCLISALGFQEGRCCQDERPAGPAHIDR